MCLCHLSMTLQIRLLMSSIFSGSVPGHLLNSVLLLWFRRGGPPDVVISVPFCSLGSVMCLGVTAGAYVLTLFAVSVTTRWLVFGLFSCWVPAKNVMCTPSQTKYRERVLGLMLVSPVCKAPSWTEWLYNKVITSSFYFSYFRCLMSFCQLFISLCSILAC